MCEIWKDIEGYEGLYQVSDRGRVKSIKKSKKILKPGLGIRGYYHVSLVKYKKKITKVIHRLVAIHFIDNPENKPCVNHKKGIKTDNRASQLEWATHSENDLHAVKWGLKYSPRYWLGKSGKDHHRSKAIIQYSKNGVIVSNYESQCIAAKQTGIRQSSISASCNTGVFAGGYIWKFDNNKEFN